MARSGEVLRRQAAGHALQRRRSSVSEGCRVSLPSEPSLQTPLPLKPLVEFTKFELTWALLSLQKRVLRVHFAARWKGTRLCRARREGPFVHIYPVAREF